MNGKNLLANEDERDESFLKRLRKIEQLSLKYSKLVVKFGTHNEEYQMQPFFPFVHHSKKFRRRIEEILDEDGKTYAANVDGKASYVLIELPDFKYDPNILTIVEDISYGVLDKNDISTSNVVKLFKVGQFLENERVMSVVETFLEESVFSLWEKCLDVLVTFDSNDISLAGTIEDDAFIHKFVDAFLSHTEVIHDRVGMTPGCQVECLLRVAQLLPPELAKHIYESCTIRKVGLDYYNKGDSTTLITCICNHSLAERQANDPSQVKYFVNEKNDAIDWLEKLPHVLPDLLSRSLFVLHLFQMMFIGGHQSSTSTYHWGFLCVFLIEATQLVTNTNTWTDKSAIVTFLHRLLPYLHEVVCYGLGKVCNDFKNEKEVSKISTHSLQQQDPVLDIRKFGFETLLSIAKHFRNSLSKTEIVNVANIIDRCIGKHLKVKTFTTHQALMIYKEFPNEARPSHTKLYSTLTIADLSTEEVLKMTELLDFDKLPRNIVEKLFQYTEMELGCEPLFLKRFVKSYKLLGKEKSKLLESMQAAEISLSSMTEGKKLVESERNAMDKGKRQAEDQRDVAKDELEAAKDELEAIKDELKEAKDQLKGTKDQLKVTKDQLNEAQDELEEEEKKSTCQICMYKHRDALSLPCMHFHYCFECLQQHHRRSKTCPTCRNKTTGLLKCILSI